MSAEISSDLASMFPQQELVLLREWSYLDQECRLYQVTWGLQVAEFRWTRRGYADFFFFTRYDFDVSMWGSLRDESFYHICGPCPDRLDVDELLVRSMAHLLGVG